LNLFSTDATTSIGIATIASAIAALIVVILVFVYAKRAEKRRGGLPAASAWLYFNEQGAPSAVLLIVAEDGPILHVDAFFNELGNWGNLTPAQQQLKKLDINRFRELKRAGQLVRIDVDGSFQSRRQASGLSQARAVAR